MRRNRRGFLAASAAAGFGARFPAVSLAQETFTFRLSLATAATSVAGLAGVRFAQLVNRGSNGLIKVDVYPSSQIMVEAESVDGLRNGVIDFAFQASTFLAAIYPRIQVLDMPFLFKNLASGYRVLDGPVGEEIDAGLAEKGVLALGWGTNGFKEIDTTTKVVSVPDDMKGLRIRIPTSPIFVATYQALGAVPVPLNVTETFTALSQHTVDGLDIGIDPLATAKFYTVIKHVAMANHFFSTQPLLASKRKIDALPANLQRVVRASAKAVLPVWRSLQVQQVTGGMEILKKNGVAFSQIQYPLFRKAMDPVYASFAPRVGTDLLERTMKAAAGG